MRTIFVSASAAQRNATQRSGPPRRGTKGYEASADARGLGGGISSWRLAGLLAGRRDGEVQYVQFSYVGDGRGRAGRGGGDRGRGGGKSLCSAFLSSLSQWRARSSCQLIVGMDGRMDGGWSVGWSRGLSSLSPSGIFSNMRREWAGVCVWPMEGIGLLVVVVVVVCEDREMVEVSYDGGGSGWGDDGL